MKAAILFLLSTREVYQGNFPNKRVQEMEFKELVLT